MARYVFRNRVKRRSSNDARRCQNSEKSWKEMERVALLLWEELPKWQQDGNQFIETGYR